MTRRRLTDMRWYFPGLVALALLAGCGKKPVPEGLQPVDVTVMTVAEQDTPVSYEFVGQTESEAQVQIVARVAGFLDKQVYNEGSLVKAGQVMFQQDPRPFQATLAAYEGALAAEQARLQVARDNLARVKPLAALNALSQKDLDDATGQEQAAQAAVQTAQANVEQARLNLSYTTIRSPVAGASSYARVNVGAYVDQTNSLLTYVSPLDPMLVNFSVSENEMLRFRTDQQSGRVQPPKDDRYEVQVILADGSTFDQKGRITFADADYNQQTGTFLLRATLPNPKGVLRPGQFVRVKVMGAVRPKAILVPQKSVLQGAQGHFVVLVDKDSKAQIRGVEVGPWYGDDWFITKGLQPGDTVVVDGVARLSPGAAVTVAKAGAPAAAAPAADKQ